MHERLGRGVVVGGAEGPGDSADAGAAHVLSLSPSKTAGSPRSTSSSTPVRLGRLDLAAILGRARKGPPGTPATPRPTRTAPGAPSALIRSTSWWHAGLVDVGFRLSFLRLSERALACASAAQEPVPMTGDGAVNDSAEVTDPR